MYQVKIFTHRDASLFAESETFQTREEADAYATSVGTGEGYWTEIHHSQAVWSNFTSHERLAHQ
jgi:hypothetical protein